MQNYDKLFYYIDSVLLKISQQDSKLENDILLI